MTARKSRWPANGSFSPRTKGSSRSKWSGLLEDFGCDVVGPLSSVDRILEDAQRGGLDGALLDVNLRGRQIFDILPRLQKLGLRLIITSGYDDVTLFPAPFRAMPRIAKPFDEGELRRICEKVFADPA